MAAFGKMMLADLVNSRRFLSDELSILMGRAQ
jgi:hypothetical protein